MTDYKAIKTDKGHAVQCPDSHLANGQDGLTKEQAEKFAEILNAFALNKPIAHKKL